MSMYSANRATPESVNTALSAAFRKVIGFDPDKGKPKPTAAPLMPGEDDGRRYRRWWLQAVQMRNEGMTAKEIAQQFGVTPNAVAMAFYKMRKDAREAAKRAAS